MPDLVAGEAFTKLRYDKRISARRDAWPALLVLDMLADNADTFEVTPPAPGAHDAARSILRRYRDHHFSYVDAVIFHMIDADPAIGRVITVDGADFRTYGFARTVEVITP